MNIRFLGEIRFSDLPTPKRPPLEPGDMFFDPVCHEPVHSAVVCPWDNCTDPRGHLMVVLPDGWVWDADARASNCALRGDRLHRCWVRHGEPPAVTVDKAGLTCKAGAGSIKSPGPNGWHGFLRGGVLA